MRYSSDDVVNVDRTERRHRHHTRPDVGETWLQCSSSVQSKLSQSNPLLGQVLGIRSTMSTDVTADNHPEQPLRFKAARDRFDGNASNVVVTNVQNATLVAAKPVYLDTPDLGRTAQWIADNQSTPPLPNPVRVRYASGSSSSDSSLSPPAMTAHQPASQKQLRRKPPSSRTSHQCHVSQSTYLH